MCLACCWPVLTSSCPPQCYFAKPISPLFIMQVLPCTRCCWFKIFRPSVTVIVVPFPKLELLLQWVVLVYRFSSSGWVIGLPPNLLLFLHGVAPCCAVIGERIIRCLKGCRLSLVWCSGSGSCLGLWVLLGSLGPLWVPFLLSHCSAEITASGASCLTPDIFYLSADSDDVAFIFHTALHCTFSQFFAILTTIQESRRRCQLLLHALFSEWLCNKTLGTNGIYVYSRFQFTWSSQKVISMNGYCCSNWSIVNLKSLSSLP